MHKSQLTAISQYIDCCFFPELAQRQQEISLKITAYFNEHLREKLRHIDSYVFDLALCRDSDRSERVVVIEVNPWVSRHSAVTVVIVSCC